MNNDDTNDDIRQTQLPAVGEINLDNQPAMTDPDDDFRSQGQTDRVYQDDLDYKDTDTDPVIDEQNDNPAETLQIPEQEFRDELDKYVVSDIGEGDDDMREMIEDQDEDDDNAASNS
jgi:hypothetical protein